jgi:Uncharacterized protein conserved in bacteria (DUF2252)
VSYGQKGERVVEGQRLMQAAGDPLLGWYRLNAVDGKKHDFYVRQMSDGDVRLATDPAERNSMRANT